MTVLDQIFELLDSKGIEYRRVQHEQTLTCEESAAARGESTKIGGKSLLLKVDDWFGLFVLSAARALDSKKIRHHLGAKRTRFATREELDELTGLVPGCVPPIGKPLFDLPLFLDESILENEKIAFNAGSLTESVILSLDDYMTLHEPEHFLFSKERPND